MVSSLRGKVTRSNWMITPFEDTRTAPGKATSTCCTTPASWPLAPCWSAKCSWSTLHIYRPGRLYIKEVQIINDNIFIKIPLFLGHPQQLQSIKNTCPIQSGPLSYGMLTIAWLALKMKRKWQLEIYSLDCFCLCLTTLIFFDSLEYNSQGCFHHMHEVSKVLMLI